MTPHSVQKSPFQLAMQRLARNRFAVAGALLLCAIALACVLLPALLALDPTTTHPALRNLAPASGHLFGTDTLGRDVLARVLVGGAPHCWWASRQPRCPSSWA